MWVVIAIACIAIGYKIYEKYILQAPSSSSFLRDFGFALVLLAIVLNNWAKRKELTEEEQSTAK